MQHTRTLLAATLALTLAACGQQTRMTAPAASTPDQASTPEQASAPDQAAVSRDAYLVGFRENALGAQSLGAEALAAQAQVQAQAITAAGGALTNQWADISAAAVRLSPAALAKLKANPAVEYVEPDLVRYAQGMRSGGTDAGAARTGLSAQGLTAQATPIYTASGEFTWGDNALKVPTLRTDNLTGSGVAVCVGDTGIDANHPEFGRKIALKNFKNFVTGETYTDPYKTNDVSHHGTHVSGTVFAQYGSGTGTGQAGIDPNGVGGVASGANLYMARVLGNDGSGSSSGIINGVNWCADQLRSQGKGGTEDRVIVSLSLGGGRASMTEQRAYNSVYNKGVLTIAATGNDGGAVSYPAAYNNVVGVGAIDASEAKASFSNFGSQVDLVGPGVSVLSSVPLGQGAAASASGGGVTFSDVQGADKSGKGSFTGNIVKAGDGTGTAGANQFCGTSTRNAALSGNIALISRGTCSFEEKTANAVASGANAVMIYNNADGPLGMSLTNTYTVPVVGLLKTDGQGLLGKLPTTGTASVTSADYAYYDGTSMATPHVSAAAALVWATNKTLTNTQLLNKLTATARDLGAAGRDDNFGHGLVDPSKAISTP